MRRLNAGTRARIVWSTAAVSAVAMALMAAAVLLIVARLTNDRIDASLSGRLETVALTVQRTRSGSLRLPSATADDGLDATWVFDASGRRVSGPDAGRRVMEKVADLSRVRVTTRLTVHNRVFLAKPLRIGGDTTRAGVAVASESAEPYEGTSHALLGGLIALGVLVSAGAAAMTAWTVGRALRPVRLMTELAADWGKHDLDARFDLGEPTDELTDLANTLDVLLGRVAQAIRGEQLLTSEVSHELRTPLTKIRGEAELALLSCPEGEVRVRLGRIVTQVDRLGTTVTTLLSLARDGAATNRHCDVVDVVHDLAGSGDSRVRIHVHLEPTVTSGSLVVGAGAELTERVLAPVIDNASCYAGSRVVILMRREARDAVIEVTDDALGSRTRMWSWSSRQGCGLRTAAGPAWACRWPVGSRPAWAGR